VIEIDSMDKPKIDIDDVVALKLTAPQVKAAFLVAYGKYENNDIARACEVSPTTIRNWKRNEYFELLVRHIRLIDLYRNLDEYTQLKKASIASVNKMMERGLINDDVRELSKNIDLVNNLLGVFS